MELLENKVIQVRVDPARGHFSVLDKQTGVIWRADPWFGSAGEVTFQARGGSDSVTERVICDLSRAAAIEVSRVGEGVRVAFSELRTGSGTALAGSTVVARLALDGDRPDLLVSLEEIRFDTDRYRLVSTQYPARFGALESYVELGYVVVPHWEGALVPTSRVTLPPIELWMFEDMSRTVGAMVDLPHPTMPWYGTYLDREDHAGFICIVETPADAQFQVLANYSLQHAYNARGEVSPLMRVGASSPVWLASRHALGYARIARFSFGHHLDYVAMAKRYRAHSQAIGEFKSLRDKIAERPAIKRLAGAPYIALYAGYPHYAPGVHPAYAEYRYQDVTDAIRDLALNLRLPAAFVHFWGGFAQQPPRALPFDTAPGSVADLKAAVDAAHQAGYLFTLYNDFTALLEETPHWDGDLMYRDDATRHMVGRPWNRVCATQHQRLAAKVMPEVVAQLGVLATYVDCVNVFWRECYAPEHPATRQEDIHHRLALLRYLQGLGLIFGGEHIQSWAVPAVDYCNGVGTPPSAARVLSQFPVPLWHLVFHDAVVGYGHAADDYTRTARRDFMDKVLRDLLLGVPPLYFLNLFDYPQWRERIALADRATGDILRQITFDEMERHTFESDDWQLQQTRFSSGVEVTVNLSFLEKEVDGTRVPAKGFVVTGIDGQPRRGSFTLSFAAD